MFLLHLHLGRTKKADVDEHGRSKFVVHEITNDRPQPGSFGELDIVVLQQFPNLDSEISSGIGTRLDMPTADRSRKFRKLAKRRFDVVVEIFVFCMDSVNMRL